MIEANRYKLGLFVIIGVSCFIATLFFLGLSEAFQRKAKLVTLFKESVQGLDVGSPIKFKGVPIGKVSRISIRTNDKLIRVDMEVLLSVFEKDPEVKTKSDPLAYLHDFFATEVKNGLRCQLVYLGITGMKFIEIDYFNSNPANDIPNKLELAPNIFYLPSTPSIFVDMLKLMNDSLAKISKIKFEEISDEMVQTIRQIKKMLEDPKINSALSRLDEITQNLEKTTSNINNALTEEKIKEITSELTGTMKAVKELSDSAKTQLGAAKLPETTEQFRNASSSIANSREAVMNTLLKLDQTLDAIAEFVSYLDDDPSSLIKGKQKPETLKILKDKINAINKLTTEEKK